MTQEHASETAPVSPVAPFAVAAPLASPGLMSALPLSAGNAAASRVARGLRGLERAFDADFSDVRIRPDSGRPHGAVQAVTEGADIHVAPGHFSPGTDAGDRLIAHELAHVVQQRSGGTPAPTLAAELDADVAADAAVRGAPARPAAAAEPGRAQAYEAWEHRQLGDSGGGAGRRIRLPNGLDVTYGQIVALSGDFYRSPEALMRAPRGEVERILAVMDREATQAAASSSGAPSEPQVNQNNADYEMATTGHDRIGLNLGPLAGDADTAAGPHGEVREGEHVESGAPGAQAGFLDLASSNAAHFSPENIRQNWIPGHQLALDLAREAWQARHPGATPAVGAAGTAPSARAGTLPAAAIAAPGLPATAAAAAAAAPSRPDPMATPTPAGSASAEVAAPADEQKEAQAWIANGFADHFLTDAFASGHLISGSVGRTICQAFWDSNRAAIVAACWACAQADGVPPLAAAAAVGAIQGFLSSRASSLLLKTVHDFYNRSGLDVRNALGQAWKTFGDAHLAGHPETIAMAELSAHASRDAVQDVLDTGATRRAQSALDYIPDMARIAGGGFQPIDGFSLTLRSGTPCCGARSPRRPPTTISTRRSRATSSRCSRSRRARPGAPSARPRATRGTR